MKRPRTLIREIESNRARIAALREDYVRLGQEISDLVAANKAKVLELVSTEVERLGLSQMPIHDLMSSLTKLSEGLASDHTLPTSLPAETPHIRAFVKLTRNASASNRRLLESAGLHWHGRDGGWTGNVTPAQLVYLRRAFGERVQKPACDVGVEARTAPAESLPGTVSVGLARVALPATTERDPADAAVPAAQTVSTAAAKLRSFGLPRRFT